MNSGTESYQPGIHKFSLRDRRLPNHLLPCFQQAALDRHMDTGRSVSRLFYHNKTRRYMYTYTFCLNQTSVLISFAA